MKILARLSQQNRDIDNEAGGDQLAPHSNILRAEMEAKKWYTRQDSNLRPSDSKSDTLSS